jgi:hypothetical protein
MLSVPWVVIVVVVIGVHTVAVAATSVHGRDTMTMVDASVDRIGSVADNQDLPLRRCLAPTDTIDYGGDDTP